MPSQTESADGGYPLILGSSELGELIERFLSEYLSDKSPETIGTYHRALNEFRRFFASAAPPFRFAPDDVVRYKTHLSETRKLHQVSVSTYLTALRRLCQYLIDLGLLHENPAASVKGNRRPDDHSRKMLTEDEIARLMRVVYGEDVLLKRDRAIISTMVYAGLSEIEIARADMGDLEQTLMGWYLRVQGKGRKTKDQQVPLDPPAAAPLRGYLEARGRLLFRDPLFASHGNRSDGARLNTRSIRSRINLHLEAAGIKRPGVTPHSLTHSAALIWLEGGMAVEDVKRRMRHGSLDTTMIYFRKQGLHRRKSTGAPEQ